MNSKCPYCKENLRIEMTAQFIEKVDPNIGEIITQHRQRMTSAAKDQGGLLGGMMKMAAGMAQGMQGMTDRSVQIMIKSPPMVNILRCMNCGAALSVSLPEKSSN